MLPPPMLSLESLPLFHYPVLRAVKISIKAIAKDIAPVLDGGNNYSNDALISPPRRL